MLVCRGSKLANDGFGRLVEQEGCMTTRTGSVGAAVEVAILGPPDIGGTKIQRGTARAVDAL